MKRLSILVALLIMLSINSVYSQGVGINDDGSNPDGSAILDVKSTTKGFLPPRMTEQERDNLNSPASGLMIFNTTSNQMEYYTNEVVATAGTGSIVGGSMYDGPIHVQTVILTSSVTINSIETEVAIRTSTSQIEVKIYDAANGGNLLATSDNLVDAPWAGAEFNYVTAIWTFNNANFAFDAGVEYFIEFSATNGNQFFIKTNGTDGYPEGDYYRGWTGTVTEVVGKDISCIILFKTPAQWNGF